MYKTLLACLLLWLLTACSTLPEQVEKPADVSCPTCPKCPDICPATNARYDVPPGSKTLPASENILDFIVRFTGLTVDEQKKELGQVNESLSQNKLDFNYRMKAAVIYAMPGSRLHDASKAQNLLDSLVREKALDTQRKALVSLLRDYISENGKLAQENNKLLQDNIALAQKNREEQMRADGLQQTLDELKAIEKSMIDREQGLRR
jgi:hypothetical protein